MSCGKATGDPCDEVFSQRVVTPSHSFPLAKTLLKMIDFITPYSKQQLIFVKFSQDKAAKKLNHDL